MRATALEILAGRDSTVIFKRNPGWKRSLVLTLHEGASSCRLRFPRELDRLQIDLGSNGQPRLLEASVAGVRGLLNKTTEYVIAAPVRRRVVISGSGRCGTQTLSHYLDGLPYGNGHLAMARHETLHEYILPLLIKGDVASVKEILVGLRHEIESAPYYSLRPEAIQADLVLHLIRDGRQVVQSGLNRGWYDNDSLWNRIKPVFSEDRFENCCHLWRFCNENMTRCAHETFRLEDLATSSSTRARLLSTVGLKPSDKPFPRSNQGAASSDFAQWSDRQKQTFSDICGPLMDRYYPGWNPLA